MTAPAGKKILRLLMPQITIFLAFWCFPMSSNGSPRGPDTDHEDTPARSRWSVRMIAQVPLYKRNMKGCAVCVLYV